jgi:protease I
MNLKGKKIGILLESDFVEYEIYYYLHRFKDEGAEVHFLSRLWGHPSLTFQGKEWKAPIDCHLSFEDIDDDTLKTYSAIIVPGGFVSDRLRYTEDYNKLPPATEFLKRAFSEKSILKGINCHGMWLLSMAPELVKGRPLVCHPNLVGDVRLMGAVFTDQDVVVDDDLVTGRSAGHCAPFSRVIIELLSNSQS